MNSAYVDKEIICRTETHDISLLARRVDFYPIQELVRCKDCKNYGKRYVCPMFSPKKDWFCANGERETKMLVEGEEDG